MLRFESATEPNRLGSVSMPMGSYDPPDYQTPAEKRAMLLCGGVWLVFLIWPLVLMVATDFGSPAWRIVGVLALVAFIALYLFAMTYPRLSNRYPRWVTIAGYTVVMAGLVALMMPATGVGILTAAPYFMALWLFSHRLLPGIFAALVIGMTAVGVGWLVYPGHPTAALEIPVGMTTIILIIVRTMDERDELDRALSEQLALSTQREELGRTVHDVLGHSLTAITVNAQLARRLVRTDPDAAEEQLDHVLATARTALGEVRQTVTALSQPDLQEQLTIASTVLTNAGITATVPKERELPELTQERQDLFAWCLREGITNVVRHSKARSCTISVGESWLQIDDDGVGLISTENHGLRGLRNRVEEAGGTLAVGDHPEHAGTRLEVTL